MVIWDVGTFGHWYVGILVRRDIGLLVHWEVGMLGRGIYVFCNISIYPRSYVLTFHLHLHVWEYGWDVVGTLQKTLAIAYVEQCSLWYVGSCVCY